LPTNAEESRQTVGATRRISSHWRECGFGATKDAERAREDAIVVAVHDDSKHVWEDSCPAFLADKRLGQTSGLLEAWTRVQVSVDAANQAREKPLWGGFKCLGWETMRDKFFRIMEAFSDEAPTRTGDRGEHSQSMASSRERSALLGRLLDDWRRALKSCNQNKDMRTAEKEADRLQAEKKRQFVNMMSTSRRLNMDEGSGQVGDKGTFTTPGGDAAT
jgi:hypothetical protein